MKILLFIIALFIAVSADAQSRIGYTLSDIRTEYAKSNYKMKLTANANGSSTFEVHMEKCIVLYILDKDNLCYSSAIFPSNQGVLNWFVEEYNKKYVIMSSTSWKMYSEGGISYIKLIINDDSYFFVWTKE